VRKLRKATKSGFQRRGIGAPGKGIFRGSEGEKAFSRGGTKDVDVKNGWGKVKPTLRLGELLGLQTESEKETTYTRGHGKLTPNAIRKEDWGNGPYSRREQSNLSRQRRSSQGDYYRWCNDIVKGIKGMGVV